MNLKYFLGCAVAGPLLPLTYYQAKQVYNSVPKLPEARNPFGATLQDNDKRLKVLLIGESTVAGVGVDRHENGFAGTFARELSEALEIGIDWKVYAKSGYTAKKVKQLILPEIRDETADLIAVGLGGNDAFTLNTPWGWRRDILALVVDLKARFPEVPIIFSNMPPIKTFPAFTPLMHFTLGNLIEILGDELEKLAQNLPNVYYYPQKITLEDWQKRFGLTADPDEYFSDGVHPSKLTYQLLAKDLVRFLLKQDTLLTQLNSRTTPL